LPSFFELCDFALYYSHINAILPPKSTGKTGANKQRPKAKWQ